MKLPRIIVLAVLLVCVAVTSFVLGTRFDRDEKPPEAWKTSGSAHVDPQRPGEPAPIAQGVRTEDALMQVAERSVESVVNISSDRVVYDARTPRFGPPGFDDPMLRDFLQPWLRPPSDVPRERLERSLGSGVVVDDEGLVLTNNHVIERARDIEVTLSDGRTFAAEVVGTDPESDLGVLRIVDPPDDVAPLEFGDSDALRLGQTVIAIGNPFGVGQTVTMGIVSATGRANVGIVDYEDFIQTDAAINPGNSGGALVDMRGRLVGINTAILSRTGGYQGIGFAIPSNMARDILESVLEHGEVVRGWLGVLIQDVTPDLVEALGIPDASRGALVSDVLEGGPAAAAGLERGDVVIEMDETPIDSSARLRNLVARAGAGEKVRLRVLREGEVETIEVELGARETEHGTPTSSRPSDRSAGLTLEAVTPALAHRYGLEQGVEGLLVLEVAPGSPAARAGVRRGDVLIEAGKAPLTSLRDFETAYAEAKRPLAVLLQRGRAVLYVVLPVDDE